jgi:peptidoglycan/LPS O-acetylase OafA/YrhL
MGIKEKIYFKGFNGLRGIAAIIVLFGHTKEIVFPNGTQYNPIWFFLSNNGGNAVSFFFVLSGFLISYLMLIEIKDTANVNVNRFYLKRVLRIWPIYYLVIITMQFIIPIFMIMIGKDWKTVSNLSTFFYLIILPNIPYLFLDSGKLFHLWSIGVEEQFYLIWAPLVKWFKNHFLKLSIIVIISKYIALLIFEVLKNKNKYIYDMYLLVSQFRIEQMCIGSIGAYYIFKNSDRIMKHFIFNRFSQLVFFSVLAFFMMTDQVVLGNTIFGKLYYFLFIKLGYWSLPTLFLYLLINVSLNKKSILKLENKIYNFLGRISYGFYVYHFIGIIISVFLLENLGFIPGTYQYALVFYITSIIIIILIAWLSYYYFERKIILLMPPKFNTFGKSP